MKLKRRRQQKTDYRQRLALLRSGSVRAVVRYTTKNVKIQFVQHLKEGDVTLVEVSSSNVAKLGWKGHGASLPCAYLVGYLAGKHAVKRDLRSAVLDIGLRKSRKGSVLYAAAKGIIDAGVSMPMGDVLPTDAEVRGSRISAYAAHLKKESNERYQKQFSALLKRGCDPERISEHVEDVKAKIA